MKRKLYKTHISHKNLNTSPEKSHIFCSWEQNRNLSKNLHDRSFGPKKLHTRNVKTRPFLPKIKKCNF